MAAAPFRFAGSRLLAAWLAGTGASLAFTSAGAGRLFLVGSGPGERLALFERAFPRAAGLAALPGRLWLATLFQIWRLENFLDPGAAHGGHDAVFVPVTGHTTGDLDIHDIAEDGAGRPLFVATRMNALATLGARFSVRPLWRPPFIDRLALEDRCHLNGLALRDGRPAFATAASRSNLAEGWRQHRRDGGVVIDIASGEVAAAGLSLPHSPRWHAGRLWLLEAGTGGFGTVDLAAGRLETLCRLPGLPRGLAFLGAHAVIGLSRPRAGDAFDGLELGERLARAGAEPVAGLAIVNLATGDLEHLLALEGPVREVQDVAALPGLRRPMALGFRTDEIRFHVRVEA